MKDDRRVRVEKKWKSMESESEENNGGKMMIEKSSEKKKMK